MFTNKHYLADLLGIDTNTHLRRAFVARAAGGVKEMCLPSFVTRTNVMVAQRAPVGLGCIRRFARPPCTVLLEVVHVDRLPTSGARAMVGGTVTFIDEMLIQALDFDHLKWVQTSYRGEEEEDPACVSGGRGNEETFPRLQRGVDIF